MEDLMKLEVDYTVAVRKTLSVTFTASIRICMGYYSETLASTWLFLHTCQQRLLRLFSTD